MYSWRIMLEGQDRSYGYFVTLDVAALDEDAAVGLARGHAESTGCVIVAKEEVECRGECASPVAEVLSMSGRSYFDSQANCT